MLQFKARLFHDPLSAQAWLLFSAGYYLQEKAQLAWLKKLKPHPKKIVVDLLLKTKLLVSIPNPDWN